MGLEFQLTKQIVEIHPPQSIIVFSPLQLHAKTMQISMFVSSQRMRWSNDRVGTRNCFWSTITLSISSTFQVVKLLEY